MFQYRLYRHNCARVQMESEFIYVKDLRIFKNVNMKNMIIIDNSVLSFAFQLDNGIPILPYYDNKDDTELKFLSDYLNMIVKDEDLREENIKHIKMEYFLKKATKDLTVNESMEEQDDKSDYNTHNSNPGGNNTDQGIFSLNFCGSNSPNTTTNNITNCNHDNSEDNSALDNSISSFEEDKLKYNSNKHLIKRHSIFRDQLFSTLDDLKKTFNKLSEKKKVYYEK